MKVICDYCQKEAELVDSKEIYQGKSYGMIWLCRPCNAYVGTHGGQGLPLGRLANSELRQWRQKAHSAFDPKWKNLLKRKSNLSRNEARNQCYKHLAERLGLEKSQCHIAMFNVVDAYYCVIRLSQALGVDCNVAKANSLIEHIWSTDTLNYIKLKAWKKWEDRY